jgi:2-polyprenyl-3-methyl-5-hydroxy-6-metoxy-1,4-benzoquinol methylase
MNKKDELTKKVFDMYQQYPFPDADYKMDYSLALVRFFVKNAPAGKKNLLENAKIMEAGCGTGNTIIKLAEICPTGDFVGVDMVTNSLSVAKKNANLKNIKNLKFTEQNILDMKHESKFDVILCIGVLHHLSNMRKGIESLVKHIKDDGYLILWLYGKDGRFKLNLNQRMLSILLKNVSSLQKKVALTKNILVKGPNKHLECHFNVPESKIEDKWKEGLSFLLKHDNWIVDQFLHCNEKVVDMRDIFNLIEPVNLEIKEWLGIPVDFKYYIPDEDISSLFNDLTEKEKLFVLDDLLKPKYYFVVLKKKQ